jgi:hypothetical protein
MAEAIAGDDVLFLVSDSRSLAQMRMQSLLFGMHWLRRHLLPLPAATQGPPCCADSTFVVPRCDPSLRDSEGAGYHRRPDLHHQQRARGVSE